MSKRSVVVVVLMVAAVGLLAPPAGAKGKPPALISIHEAFGDESTGTVVFQLTRTGKGLKTATVTFQTVAGSGTAEETAGEDYTATAGTATFSGRTTTTTVAVPVTKDTVYEDNETFGIELLTPSAGSAINGSAADATGTIVDDDQPGTWTLNPGDILFFDQLSLAACHVLSVDVYESTSTTPLHNVFSKGTGCDPVTAVRAVYVNQTESVQTVRLGLTDSSCTGGFDPQTFFSDSTSYTSANVASWDFAAVSLPVPGVWQVRIMDAGDCFYTHNRRPGDVPTDTGNFSATVSFA